MSASKPKKTISPAIPLAAAGVCLILFSLLLFLSPRTRIRYLSFPLHFLFGTVGFIILSVFLFEGGLHLLLNSRWGKSKARVRIGVALFILASWLLIAQAIGGTYTFEANNSYYDALMQAYAGSGQELYFSPSIAAGYLGGALLAAIDAVGVYLAYLIFIPLILLSLFIVFFPWIKKGNRALRANITVSKAKRRQEKEEAALRKQSDFVIESSDDDPLPYLNDAPSSNAPKLSFAEAKETEKEAKAPTLMGEYVFAPAGGSTLPKRRSLRAERVQTPIMEAPSPVQFQTPLRELANPNFDNLSANPVRTTGLKEAFFNPEVAESNPVPSSPAPQVSPIPMRMAEPLAPAHQEPERPVEEKKVEKVEEAPLPPSPSFAPSFLDPQPSSPEPEIYEERVDGEEEIDEETIGEEEDERPYENTVNEPIVLAPNPTMILTPETVAPAPTPKIEPAPEPPSPPVDDDKEPPLPPYVFPTADLLDEGSGNQDTEAIRAECQQKAVLIDQIFASFHVGAHVTDILVGPSITRYSIEADDGVSVQSISRVIPDLEVRLGGVPVRFVERVFGMACSALEVANDTRRIVSFKEMFVALPPRKETADLKIPFGLAIDGSLKQADLSKFPHMLVAGTSGSGKSIFSHGILMSLIMRNRPEDLKLVLIDPKRGVEMAPYRDMPHLFCPIIKEAVPAKNALKKLCDLMDKRYDMLAEAGVRDIGSYNADYALPQGKKRMPYIVVLVDEFADLVGECKEISEYVLRIAQKARACGIHLIVATQRPDVKVITGTIKSNLLCRVALTVASSQDSVTILGQGGAEDLYGYGDMLIDCQEISKRDFVRAQGCLTTQREMKNVCDFVRKQLPPMYDPDFLNLEDEEEESGPEIRDGGYAPVPTMSSAELKKISDDEKYNYVKSVIMTREYCSISMIQREFEVGFPRAGKILARLQQDGIVAAPDGTANNSKGCRVLVHDESELPQQ